MKNEKIIRDTLTYIKQSQYKSTTLITLVEN